jgi:branched-chain amino acid transport system substrate-binding protein
VNPTLTRRDLLRAAGAGGALLFAGPVLAACGGGSGGTGGASGSDIAKMLGVNAASAAKGMDFQLGAVLALSGPGSYYGGTMSNGIDLAVAQIKAAGGPNFKVIYKDHKSGDAQAGVTAVKELGIAGVKACLASYVDDLGAMLPGTAQYKMLTLDGGGGTAIFGQAQSYFWGTRAITPDDTYPGVLTYIKQVMPKVRSVATVGWDLGPLNDPEIASLKAALAAAGMDFVTFEPVPIGATDYSTTLSRLRSLKFDLLFVSVYGLDPGYFMKQYITSGIDKPMVGFEFTADAAKVAGPAYDTYHFAYDYFDPKHPTNPFAKLFVDSFRKASGKDPDFYAANFYENTFAIWDLIERVVARGGDPNDGTNLQNELTANPTFKSVYGGDANTVGTYTLDLKSHSVSKRPMGLFSYKGGRASPLASFGIGASDFKKISTAF